VRELRNIVIRLTTKYSGQKVNAEQLQSELDMESLEDVEVPGIPLGQDFKSVLESARKHLQRQKNFSLDETVQQWERAYVEAALTLTQGNLSQAAKLLGIHRTTLYSRMQATPRRARQRARHIDARPGDTRLMYLEHFGLREPPVQDRPQRGVLLRRRQPRARAGGAALRDCAGRGHRQGHRGSGQRARPCSATMLQARLPQHVETVYIANPGVSPRRSCGQ